jgi:hypothetical protein
MNKRIVLGCIVTLMACLSTQAYAEEAEDKFAILNQDDEQVFLVNDKGDTSIEGALLTNGATTWGSAPFVLGQNPLNRGMVITDKAFSNPKNIYFGWNVGETLEYAEIFALQEGIGWKDLVLVPYGGNLGIGTNSPSFPLQMGGGAYCTGQTWVNASSREYKNDIKELTRDEAMETLDGLNPVRFKYKNSPDDEHIGFISEDVPDLVATKDRKGMNSMDVVAVLTKVVKEQQRILQQQKRTITHLSHRLAQVEFALSEQAEDGSKGLNGSEPEGESRVRTLPSNHAEKSRLSKGYSYPRGNSIPNG